MIYNIFIYSELSVLDGVFFRHCVICRLSGCYIISGGNMLYHRILPLKRNEFLSMNWRVLYNFIFDALASLVYSCVFFMH